MDTRIATLSDMLRLNTKLRARLPGRSLLEALMFMVKHDSYHVGQISLLRSQAGLPAMKYD